MRYHQRFEIVVVVSLVTVYCKFSSNSDSKKNFENWLILDEFETRKIACYVGPSVGLN